MNKIRYEAKCARLRDAQKKCRLTERRAQVEGQLKELACVRDEQAKLAAERLKQINELQQQIQSRQVGEAELAARQQLMQEELVRAEAQFDLIKDMLLLEPRL